MADPNERNYCPNCLKKQGSFGDESTFSRHKEVCGTGLPAVQGIQEDTPVSTLNAAMGDVILKKIVKKVKVKKKPKKKVKYNGR